MSVRDAALDKEISLLRERLEGAEEMRRAILAEQIDGFIVGEGEPERVVLLESSLAAAARADGHPAVTVSRQGSILHGNRAFAALVGCRLGELYNVRLAEFVVADQRDSLRAFIDAGVPDSVLDVMLALPGRTRPAIRLVTLDVGHGYVSLLVLAASDEFDGAESAVDAISRGEVDGIVVGGTRVVLVNDADHAYREIIDRMAQGAVSITRHGDVLYANEPFVQMLGAGADTLLGTSLFRWLHEPSAALEEMLRNPAPPRTRVAFEAALRRADGSALHVEMSIDVPEGDAPFTLVLTDLTERRRHRRIEEETRRKDEFLAVLGHELRNPLASIRSCTEILHRSPGLGEKERSSVEIIGRQTEALVRLVDDLLDIHRLNEGKIVIHRQPVALQSIVRNAVEAARPYLAAKSLTLQTALPEEPIYVEADDVRMVQVILNVLSNAAKFTPDGGEVRIELAPSPQPGEGAEARLTIVDTGCGIEPAQVENIFEPYVQVDKPGDGTASGLGLGLSVARRLVELHGGSIRAESDGIGQGARFVLTLPACKPPGAAVSISEELCAPDAAEGLRVLIVDDSRDAAESLAMFLGMAGHEARAAFDGASAIALGQSFRPHVVFLDIGMPVLDGYATARKLRESDWGRAAALYALSGFGRDDFRRRRSHDAGFDRHFVKPIDPDLVLQVLREVSVNRDDAVSAATRQSQ